MKENRRSVVLFGAGAAIDWGGPPTSYLTELTRTSGSSFLTKDAEQVTKFIYNSLLNSGHKADETNFETIINAIEELIVHYAYFNAKEKTPSISKVLFNSFGDDFWNFSIAGGEEKHGYRLQIPKGQEYDYAEHSHNNESPHQFYFQHLLSLILININARVSEYSFRKPEEIVSGPYQELNQKFITWYSALNEDSVVRMYTLNYDRNFKFLAEHSGTAVFEGFSQPIKTEERYLDGQLELDKILNDFESPIHYSLHGSSYWKVHPRDEYTQLNNIRVSLRPHISLSNESPTLQIDRGKNVQISNIITGYHKTQKSFVAPFRQMQSAFDRDCMSADNLIVIGYSFGDFHVNSSIVNALKHNKKIKVHFIDPAYVEENDKKGLVQRLIYIFPDVLRFERTPPIYSSDKDSCTYFKGKLKVTTLGFEDYLTTKGKYEYEYEYE